MATLAPWLQPQDFLGAIRAGAGLGLQVRERNDAEVQAAETLRQAQESLFQRQQQMAQAAQQAQVENQLKQQAMAQAQAQQQQENMMRAQQLAQSQQEQQSLMALRQNEEARKQNLFNQQAQFAQLAKSQVLPGGGDFEGGDAEEQKALIDKQRQKNLDELIRNAPQDILPSLIEKLSINQMNNPAERTAILGATRLENLTGMPVLNDEGTKVDPVRKDAALKRMQEIATKRQMTTIQKQAEDYVAQIKEQDPEVSDDALKLEKEKFIASQGASAKTPPDTLKKIEAGDTIIQGLDSAFDAIKKFNDKFGENAFDQFTGPIEGRLQKLKSRFGNMTAEDELNARTIWSSIAQIEQAYRQANFGTALTSNEINQFKNIVEDPTSSAFIPTVKAFRDTTERITKNYLSNRPYASDIPTELRKKYYRKDSKSTSTSSGKYRIISVSQ